MAEFLWHDAYRSDLQSLYSLWIAPLAFLAWRATVPVDPTQARVPEAARFVSGLTLFFAFATMIDPLCTGPLSRLEGMADTFAPTLIAFFFVLLGDLRVLLLAIGVARPERELKENLAWAAGLSLVVPIFAGTVYAILDFLIEDLHGQVLWMVYEGAFVVLCIALSRRWIPRSLEGDPLGREKASYLREIFGYSAAYYCLWLTADILIVVGDLDLGWGVRIVPNQLYYAIWVPFAHARFFRAKPGS